MKLSDLLLLAIAFLAGAGLTYWLVNTLMNTRLSGRLKRIREENLDENQPAESRIEQRARQLMAYLVKFSKNEEQWSQSATRIRFLNAGYRGDSIVLLYFGSKTLLALVFPVLYFIMSQVSPAAASWETQAFKALMAAALGYYLPNVLLHARIRQRQRELFESFPDALDLIRVCVSAGLGLDAAIARVGAELVATSHSLADEFRQLSLELRAGASRSTALRNLAVRTGIDDINALVAMLIQSERFGTSVSDSLRVHAEALRDKRMIRAQEAAAKIPVKLTVPMAFCILPALFVVVLGPAILGILHHLGSLLGAK
jgi:tight adherence protein C